MWMSGLKGSPFKIVIYVDATCLSSYGIQSKINAEVKMFFGPKFILKKENIHLTFFLF